MFDFTERADAQPKTQAPPEPRTARDIPLSRAHILALQQSAGNAAVSRMLARTPQPERAIARAVSDEATAMSITPEYAQSLSDDELFEAFTAVQDRLSGKSDPELAEVLAANLAVLEAERSSPQRLNQTQPAEDDGSRLIDNAIVSIGSQVGEQMWSCIRDGGSGDLMSPERLEYAVRLARASWDAYNGPVDGDEQSRGDQRIDAGLDNHSLTRVSDEDLLTLGLDREDFNSDSGYQAVLYVDEAPLAEPTKCLPAFEDFKRQFAKDNPELGHFAAQLFPEAMAPEQPKPDAEPPKHYVLANRGTEEAADLPANVGQAIGMPTDQYEEAKALGRIVYEKVGGRVTFTGHSLGGGLAAAQALITGARAVTFNAAGLDDATIDALGGAEGAEQRITAYNVEGDLLSSLQDASPLTSPSAALAWVMDSAVGERGELPSRGLDVALDIATSSSPLLSGYRSYKKHGIESVIAALEAELEASREGER